jgi:RNA recognition motif-containing protein
MHNTHNISSSFSTTSSLSCDSDDFYPEIRAPVARSSNSFANQACLTEEQFLHELMLLRIQDQSITQQKYNSAAHPVNELESTRRLFVGDLSFFCTEKDLFPVFAQFGQVQAVDVRRGTSGESLQYAFVSYVQAQSAVAAMSALNGKEFQGRKLR